MAPYGRLRYLVRHEMWVGACARARDCGGIRQELGWQKRRRDGGRASREKGFSGESMRGESMRVWGEHARGVATTYEII